MRISPLPKQALGTADRIAGEALEHRRVQVEIDERYNLSNLEHEPHVLSQHLEDMRQEAESTLFPRCLAAVEPVSMKYAILRVGSHG